MKVLNWTWRRTPELVGISCFLRSWPSDFINSYTHYILSFLFLFELSEIKLTLHIDSPKPGESGFGNYLEKDIEAFHDLRTVTLQKWAEEKGLR
jgi:hypothetical protein